MSCPGRKDGPLGAKSLRGLSHNPPITVSLPYYALHRKLAGGTERGQRTEWGAAHETKWKNQFPSRSSFLVDFSPVRLMRYGGLTCRLLPRHLCIPTFPSFQELSSPHSRLQIRLWRPNHSIRWLHSRPTWKRS